MTTDVDKMEVTEEEEEFFCLLAEVHRKGLLHHLVPRGCLVINDPVQPFVVPPNEREAICNHFNATLASAVLATEQRVLSEQTRNIFRRK